MPDPTPTYAPKNCTCTMTPPEGEDHTTGCRWRARQTQRRTERKANEEANRG